MIFVIFSFLIALTFYVVFNEKKNTKDIKLERIDNKGTESIQIGNTNISEIDNGRTKWELNAESIENTIESAFLKNISGEIFSNKGRVIKFSAKGGNLCLETKNLEISDEIELKYPLENVTLRLNNLSWNNSKNQLTGSKDITLESKDVYLNAEEIIFDKNLKVLKIHGEKILIEVKGL